MTIEELYEWAKVRGFEDCHIVVNYPGADGLNDHLLTEDNIGVPYNQGTNTTTAIRMALIKLFGWSES